MKNLLRNFFTFKFIRDGIHTAKIEASVTSENIILRTLHEIRCSLRDAWLFRRWM